MNLEVMVIYQSSYCLNITKADLCLISIEKVVLFFLGQLTQKVK